MMMSVVAERLDEMSGIYTYYAAGQDRPEEDEPSLGSGIYTTTTYGGGTALLFSSAQDTASIVTENDNPEATTVENGAAASEQVYMYEADVVGDDPSLVSGIFTTTDGGPALSKSMWMPSSSESHHPPGIVSSGIQATINRTLKEPPPQEEKLPQVGTGALDDDYLYFGGERDFILNWDDHNACDEVHSIMSSLADEMSFLPWVANAKSPSLLHGGQETSAVEEGKDSMDADDHNIVVVLDDDGTSSVLSGSVLGGAYARSVSGRLECRNHNNAPIQTFRPSAYQKTTHALICATKAAAIVADNDQDDKDDDGTCMSSCFTDDEPPPTPSTTEVKVEGSQDHFRDAYTKEGQAPLVEVRKNLPSYRLELLQILDNDNTYYEDVEDVPEENTAVTNPSIDNPELSSSSRDGASSSQEKNAIRLRHVEASNVPPVPSAKVESSPLVLARPLLNKWARANAPTVATSADPLVEDGSIATTKVSQSDSSEESSADNNKGCEEENATSRQGLEADSGASLDTTVHRWNHHASKLLASKTITITRIVSTPGHEPRIQSVSTTTVRVMRRKESRMRRVLRRCGWRTKREFSSFTAMPTIHEMSSKNLAHHPVQRPDEVDLPPEKTPGQRLGGLFSCFGKGAHTAVL
mmetsp:Transcript_5376/g.10683  ORF Transcript_5376/g.10683 Transcript_5376/m.10683 type:complete len:639 (-) Transcript_5376:78-1994(-)